MRTERTKREESRRVTKRRRRTFCFHSAVRAPSRTRHDKRIQLPVFVRANLHCALAFKLELAIADFNFCPDATRIVQMWKCQSSAYVLGWRYVERARFFRLVFNLRLFILLWRPVHLVARSPFILFPTVERIERNAEISDRVGIKGHVTLCYVRERLRPIPGPVSRFRIRGTNGIRSS